MTKEIKSLFWHRVKLLALVSVFLAPFIGGWLALYVFEIRPGSINYGTLVQPVKKLEWPVMQSVENERFESGFGRKWTFLLFASESCGDQCQSNLFYMRQIRTLLNRDIERLQNVLVMRGAIDSETTEFIKDYPDFVVIDGFQDEALLKQFALEDVYRIGDEPRMYLVDPDDNFMMHYPPQSDQNRILEDLRKLMKLSKIG